MDESIKFKEIFKDTPFKSFQDIIDKTKTGEIVNIKCNIYARSILYDAATVLDRKITFWIYWPQILSLLSLIYFSIHYNSWWILLFIILSFFLAAAAIFFKKSIWFIGVFAICGFIYFPINMFSIISVPIAFTIVFSYIGHSIWLNKCVDVILKNILIDEELFVYLFKKTAIFIYTSDGNFYTGEGMLDKIHRDMKIDNKEK